MALAIDQARGDGGAAFAAIYAETRPALVRYCRRLVGPDGDAEGLAQEALVRGWRAWDPVAEREFWPWAVTVARNLAIDESRKAGRRANHAFRAGLAAAGQRFPDPEDEVVRASEHETVRKALDDLPAPYRTALQMHHVDGRSYQEIADHQHVSVETVRGMLRRARQALRAAYGRLDEVSAVVTIGAVLRRVRLRLDGWAARTQARLVDTGSLFVPVEAVRGVVAIALVIGGGAATVAPDHPAGPGAPAQVAAHRPASGKAKAGAAGTHALSAGVAGAPDAASDEASPAPPAAGLPLGLDGATVTTPEEAWFGQLVAPTSPAAGSTLFAVGQASTGCPGVDCNVLFRSDDMGASWRRLPAKDFRGGTVMLPPSWPADPRLFAVSSSALQESADGDAFVAYAPGSRTAAMSPGFSTGDPVIWVGFAPGWVYHDDTKSLSPMELWPPPVADAATYAFAPAWPADRRILVGGLNVAPDGTPSASVTRCETSACGQSVSLPGVSGTPQLLALPSFGRTGLAFAWAGDRLMRTSDAGTTFAGLALPGPGKVTSLVATADDHLYLALADVTPEGEQIGGLYVSDDHGDSWRHLGAKTRLTRGVTAVVARPDGHILAGVQATAGGGLLCSSNAGKTWARRCA